MPPLDPLNDMKIRDANLEENLTKLEALERRKSTHPLRQIYIFLYRFVLL